MQLTMTKKRAREIIGLAVNHEIRGLEDPKKMQRLMEVSLPELIEAELIIKRINTKSDQIRQKRKFGRFTSYIHFGCDQKIAEFYYELHGGVTVPALNSALSNLNECRLELGEEELNLWFDGDWFGFETNQSKEAVGEVASYFSTKSLVSTINQLSATTTQSLEAQLAEGEE